MKKCSTFILTISLVILSVFSVNASGFKDELGFTYEKDTSGNLAVIGYDGIEMDVPPSYYAYPITSIKYMAFMDNTALESLSFENAINLKSIGLYSFAGCTSLQSVNIPWGISNISTAAFKGCTAMTEVGYYSNGGKVSNECFSGCTALNEVALGEYITTIGNFAFANCTALEYLELPASVTAIGNNAFLNDENLTLGVYYDSFAQTYAEENNIPYVIIDGVKLGDVNGDKIVNINDVTAIQSHLAEMKKLDGIFLKAADTNRDGEVKIDDATTLQMYLAEYEVQYPIDEEMAKL